MALGCPVFATDVGGTGEIIQDGVNGFLLDPIAPDSWVQRFTLVNDPELMGLVGENARLTASQRFSSKTHSDEFLTFFQTSIHRFSVNHNEPTH